MARGRVIAILSVSLVLTTLIAQSQGRMLGRVGAVYPIAERDALEEIEERVRGVNWEKKFSAASPQAYRPAQPAQLPLAQRERVFLLDPSYRLERDLRDGDGRVLYPAGYTFNPLDYLPEVPTLVVIDGENPGHLAWLEQLPLLGEEAKALVLLTRGDYEAIGARLGRRVFYIDRLMVERLSLSAIPCVVRRKARYLEVQEIVLESTRN